MSPLDGSKPVRRARRAAAGEVTEAVSFRRKRIVSAEDTGPVARERKVVSPNLQALRMHDLSCATRTEQPSQEGDSITTPHTPANVLNRPGVRDKTVRSFENPDSAMRFRGTRRRGFFIPNQGLGAYLLNISRLALLLQCPSIYAVRKRLRVLFARHPHRPTRQVLKRQPTGTELSRRTSASNARVLEKPETVSTGLRQACPRT